MTNTNQVMTTGAQEDSAAVDERLKQSILDKRQADIDAWDRQIEQLEGNFNQLTDEARQEAQKRLDQLVQARDQGMEQLQHLRQATRSNWETLLQQSDATFQNMADRFHNLLEKNT
jgi:vacuolar-type H+-ATPase subunit H